MTAHQDAAPLPRIVRFLGTDDCPDSTCPHCGSTGRFIHRFLVEDGRTLAAMSGCVKLFPVASVAIEEQRLMKKKADYAKRGWHLNSRDRWALDQIARFYAKEIDERSAMSAATIAKRSNQSRYRR